MTGVKMEAAWRVAPCQADHGESLEIVEGDKILARIPPVILNADPNAEAKALQMAAARELATALENLLTSARDQRNGYPERELHEPWRVFEARAVRALRKSRTYWAVAKLRARRINQTPEVKAHG